MDVSGNKKGDSDLLFSETFTTGSGFLIRVA